jgi:lipoprotein-anchoring transpeptidase ErfK/SrfK
MSARERLGGTVTSKIRTGAVATALAAVLLAAGCTARASSANENAGAVGAGNGVSGGAAASSSPPPVPAAPPAVLTIQPAGATALNPTVPIKVAASSGRLTSVKLTAAGGGPVAGKTSADKLSWVTATPLAYGSSYIMTATAVNAEGKPTTKTAAFRTLLPSNKTLPEIRLDNAATYGVGQPIPIHFDEPIADKKAAEKALTITTTPKVAGSWHWFDDQNVHWRPQAYWKPGTKITVAANVFGVQVGSGLYGQQNVAASITIGRSKIAKANHDTHQIEVYLDGKLARTIPTSMGQGGGITTKNGNWISLSTNSGPHVVLGKQASVHMTSASFGLPKDDPSGEGYDVWLPYGVQISGGGEYVHVNANTVGDQGYRNVSHGCLNVSPTNGEWFYNTFDRGDVVDVTGTGQQLDPQDGYGDWTLSWASWTAGSALP